MEAKVRQNREFEIEWNKVDNSRKYLSKVNKAELVKCSTISKK